MRFPEAAPAFFFLFALALVPSHAARAATPVAIFGVEDDDLRRAMRDALPERDAPADLFEAERLAEEAAEIVVTLLRSRGYYAGVVEPSAGGEPPIPAVTVNVGPLFRFRPPEFGFPGGEPRAEAAIAVREAIETVEPGAAAQAAEVLAAEAAAIQALREQGYPDAEALPRRAIVDHADETMSVAFAFAPGEAARLGALRVRPGGLVSERVVGRLQEWRRGEYYSPEIIAATRSAFSGTGVFSRATATLDEIPGPDGARDVLVDLAPAPPRSIALGASFSTLEGAGVDAQWSYRNALERLETFTARARLAELEQLIGADLIFPHALGRNRSRSFAAELAQEDTEAFERQALTLSTTVDSKRRERLAIAYGLSFSASLYDAQAGIDSAYTTIAFAEARFDSSDSPLDPREGAALTGRVAPGIATGDAGTTFVRSTLEGRAYQTFDAVDWVTFASRAELGWVAAFSGADEDLPLEQRFYAGGGGSVRGYGFNSIFPDRRLAFAETPGGQGLVEVSNEARLRFTERWGAAVFVDGGAAFDEFADAGDLRWGAGVGLRYDLGFAPLRIDIAAPLDRREQDQAFAFYVSLGQAF